MDKDTTMENTNTQQEHTKTSKESRRLPQWLISIRDFFKMLIMTPIALIQRIATRIALGQEGANEAETMAKSDMEQTERVSNAEERAKNLEKDWNRMIEQKMKDPEYKDNPLSIKSVEVYVPKDVADKKFVINIECQNGVQYKGSSDYAVSVTWQDQLMCTKMVHPDIIKQIEALWEQTKERDVEEVKELYEQDETVKPEEAPAPTNDSPEVDNITPITDAIEFNLSLDGTLQYTGKYQNGLISFNIDNYLELSEQTPTALAVMALNAVDNEIKYNGNKGIASAWQSIREDLQSKDEPKAKMYVIPTFNQNGQIKPLFVTAHYKTLKDGGIDESDNKKIYFRCFELDGQTGALRKCHDGAERINMNTSPDNFDRTLIGLYAHSTTYIESQELQNHIQNLGFTGDFRNNTMLTTFKNSQENLSDIDKQKIDRLVELNNASIRLQTSETTLYCASPADKSVVSLISLDGGVIQSVCASNAAPKDSFLSEVSDLMDGPLTNAGAYSIIDTFKGVSDADAIYKNTHNTCCLVDVPYEGTCLPAVFTYKDGVVSGRIINTDIVISSEKDEFQPDIPESSFKCIESVYKQLTSACQEHVDIISNAFKDTELSPLPNDYSIDDLSYEGPSADELEVDE